MLCRQFPKVQAMLRDAAEDITAFAAFRSATWKKISSADGNVNWVVGLGATLPQLPDLMTRSRSKVQHPAGRTTLTVAGTAVASDGGGCSGPPGEERVMRLKVLLRCLVCRLDEPCPVAGGRAPCPILGPGPAGLLGDDHGAVGGLAWAARSRSAARTASRE